jgi:hypothetical protein
MARYRRIDLRAPTVAGDGDPIEAVRSRRAGLKAAMSGLELALAAAAPGRASEWASGVQEALDRVHEEWTRHMVETEAPGAFLDELVAEAPRLANQVARLRDEHGEILGDLLAAEEALGRDAVDVDDLRARLTGLLCALARHRQRGADLVYEAYDVDIGGGA